MGDASAKWWGEPQMAPLSGVVDPGLKLQLEEAINLMENTIRGLVAEVLVAEALSGQVTPPWDPWDVDLPWGERVEVKATGYFQAWAQAQRSVPAWTIHEAGAWLTHDKGSVWDEVKNRRSTLYVFCLHKGINPGEPSEWEFRPVDTSTINAVFGSQASVRLTSLDTRVGPPVMTFSELREWGRERSERL